MKLIMISMRMIFVITKTKLWLAAGSLKSIIKFRSISLRTQSRRCLIIEKNLGLLSAKIKIS